MTEKWDIVVDADKSSLSVNFKEIWKCRDLIQLLVRRSFVAQYKQTVLGPAWAIIQPLCSTIVFSIFFGNIAGLGAAGVPNFIFYFSGNIIWSLFAHCLTGTAGTFINNSSIMGKVYFPRLVMPITIVLSKYISFGIQYGLMLCFLIYYAVARLGVQPNLYILMTPILLVHITLLGMGVGAIVSALTTKYRDLNMVLGFGVGLWSYCSPIAYDMFSRGPLKPGAHYYACYMLNPVTPIINAFRFAYLGIGEIDWLYYGISWVMTILVAVCGMLIFNKVEKNFIDTI